MSKFPSSVPLIRRPWFAFFSFICLAVALLSLLGMALIIGTVSQQSRPQVDCLVKLGPFWSQTLGFLGLYDVYASVWSAVIIMFLVTSTGLCLIRNILSFLRKIRSFREDVKEKLLVAVCHSIALDGQVTSEVAQRHLEVRGYSYKTVIREDGSVLVAAKKDVMNKWGYIFAYATLIVVRPLYTSPSP